MSRVACEGSGCRLFCPSGRSWLSSSLSSAHREAERWSALCGDLFVRRRVRCTLRLFKTHPEIRSILLSAHRLRLPSTSSAQIRSFVASALRPGRSELLVMSQGR